MIQGSDLEILLMLTQFSLLVVCSLYCTIVSTNSAYTMALRLSC